MIKASNRYKSVMGQSVRNRAYISVSLGIVNQQAQQDSKIVSDKAYFSSYNVFSSVSEYDYATYEENYFKADGSQSFCPKDTILGQFLNCGYATNDIMGAVKIDFGNTYAIRGLTIDFGFAYPKRFRIESDNYSFEYENNQSDFTCESYFGDTDHLIITPLEMVGGQQRLRIRYIKMGVGIMFDNSTAESFSISNQVSLISADASSANYNLVLFDKEHRFDVDSKESFMAFLEPMQKIEISMGVELDNDTVEWIKVANASIKSWSVSDDKLSIQATDLLTQIEDEYADPFEPVLDENNVLKPNRTAYQQAQDILSRVYPNQPDMYEIDSSLNNIMLANPMPAGSYRESLQLLSNATRCIVFEDENAKMHIKAGFENVLDPDDMISESDNATPWSNPSNILNGATVEYATYARFGFRADGTMTFMPKDAKLYSKKTAYVSDTVVGTPGGYVPPSEPISFSVVLPATYDLYGYTIEFGDAVPYEMTLELYNDDVLVNSIHYTEIEKVFTVAELLTHFNKLVFNITQAPVNSRVVINRFNFGTSKEYNLTKDLLLSDPIRTKDERIKDVWVKIYTYEKENDNIRVVDDNIFAVATLNTTGTSKFVENPLISDCETASNVAEWVANYYGNDVSYDVTYRGEPRLQPIDIVGLYSPSISNLQATISKTGITFNGAFKGTLELRRAVKIEDITISRVVLQEAPPKTSQDVKIDKIETKVDGFDGRIDTVETKVEDVEQSVGGYDSRISAVESGLSTKQDASTAITTSNIGNQTVFRAARLGGEESQNQLTARSYAGTPIEGYSLTFFQQDLTNKCVNIGINGAGAVGVNRAKVADSATTAGSCSGNAATATALQSTSVGGATQPVYFDADGKPVACTTYANASVKSAGSATKATQDGNGVTIAGTYLKRKEITLSNKKLTANTNNEFTYTKTGGTVVGACFRQCWPKTTWTNAVCSIVQCSTDGALTITTMATQNYDMVVCILYV